MGSTHARMKLGGAESRSNSREPIGSYAHAKSCPANKNAPVGFPLCYAMAKCLGEIGVIARRFRMAAHVYHRVGCLLQEIDNDLFEVETRVIRAYENFLHGQDARLNTRLAFWPPKAKLLDMANSTSFLTARLGV